MRVLMGLLFLLLTLGGVAVGGYVGFILTKNSQTVFWCALGGLLFADWPCGAFYQHMFPKSKD